MRPTISLLLTVAMMVLVPGIWAHPTVDQITNNAHEDNFPQVKGNHVVWQGYVDGDWEIFLYDLGTGVTTQITDNDYNDLSPQTDGQYVVWQGFKDEEWDVFLWEGSQVFAISDRGAEDTLPQISNGFVVWASKAFEYDDVYPAEIMLYDCLNNTITVLSVDVDPGNSFDDSSPKINHEGVMWTQTDDQGHMTSYMYEFAAGTISENPDYAWRDNAQRDGSLSVLSRHDSRDREIFIYDSGSRKYLQITDNVFQDMAPSMSDYRVAWVADGEIFLAMLSPLSLLNPPNQESLQTSPVPTFTWETLGCNAYKVEFSKDQDFSTGDVLALPRRGKKPLTEKAFTPPRRQWRKIRSMALSNGVLYWRVKGEDAKGNAVLSETFGFTMEERSRLRRLFRRWR